MHILLTVNSSWNAVHFRRSLITKLLDDDHRVTVLAPEDAGLDALLSMGCRFIPLSMDIKGLSPLRDLSLMLTFVRHFARERPDAILSFTIKNNIFGAIAARRAGMPFIPNVTGLGTAFLSGGLLQRIAEMLYRLAFRNLPVVFFQNEDDLAFFLDRKIVNAGQAKLLPGSGIDLAHFSANRFSEHADGPIFLMIARLLRDKGVIEYVEAARLLKGVLPGARFQLLGPPGTENRTAIDLKTVEAWDAEGAIEYLGETEDVRPFIAEADCIVLPSYREGAPRTLIEASAMARPVIATDVPGCRAVVEDGITGFFCAARSGESLAAACQRFAALPIRQREAMGLAGRRKMEREFDQEIVVAAYRKALQDFLEGS